MLTCEEDVGCRAVTSDVILSGGRSCDQRCSRMLDLLCKKITKVRHEHGRKLSIANHLVQEHIAVFGELDVTSAGHEHLNGPVRTQVRRQDALQALRRPDIHLHHRLAGRTRQRASTRGSPAGRRCFRRCDRHSGSTLPGYSFLSSRFDKSHGLRQVDRLSHAPSTGRPRSKFAAPRHGRACFVPNGSIASVRENAVYYY